MKPAVRRRILVSLPTLAIVLGGCSIHEQTQGWHPRYDGQPAEAGDIGLRNVVVVTSGDGQATVLTSFANRGEADELVGVTVNDVAASPANGPVQIPAGGYTTLGPGGEQIDISGVELQPGRLTEVEFEFGNAPRVTVDAMVKEAAGRYAEVTFPEPQPTSTEPVEPTGPPPTEPSES